MYDQTSIELLKSRIGFGSMEIEVDVQPHHRIGSSGRTLPYFHKLANLRNIYNTAEASGENPDMTPEEFDAHLDQLKEDSVKSILDTIFKYDPDYLLIKDYNSLIAKYETLFDTAIGYSLAVSAIEQMVTTNRSNQEERNARLSYDKLKIELEGLKDGYGNIVSSGLIRAQYLAAKDVAGILFPTKLTIHSYPW